MILSLAYLFVNIIEQNNLFFIITIKKKIEKIDAGQMIFNFVSLNFKVGILLLIGNLINLV